MKFFKKKKPTVYVTVNENTIRFGGIVEESDDLIFVENLVNLVDGRLKEYHNCGTALLSGDSMNKLVVATRPISSMLDMYTATIYSDGTMQVGSNLKDQWCTPDSWTGSFSKADIHKLRSIVETIHDNMDEVVEVLKQVHESL